MTTLAPLASAFPLKPLKYIAPLRGEKVDAVPIDGEYLGLEQLESWSGKLSGVELEQPPEGGANVFQTGDVLFGKLRPYLAKGWVADRPGYCTGESLVLSPSDADARFVRYCLLTHEVISAIDSSTYGSKMPRADWGFVGSVYLPHPKTTQQERIANFLDVQTARIDALIAEKELLVERLAEYRLSLVEAIITGGEAPRKKMVSEGPFQAIPEHWELPRNKELFCEVDERSTNGSEELLTVSHLTGVTRRADKSVNMFLAESLEGYKRCEANDFVVNTMWAWMGAMGISPLNGVVSPSYNVYRIRNTSRLLHAYYDLVCRAPGHVGLVKSLSTGVWESRLRLYPDAFLNIRTPLPPIQEQASIVDNVGRKLCEVNAVMECVPSSLALLREYRSSLISAAVTGQLDIGKFKEAA